MVSRRKRAELTARHAISSVWSNFGDSGDYVTTEFLHIEGIEAVRNRRIWVRQAKPELAKALGAIPAKDIPEYMRLSLSEVIAWLKGTKPR